MEGNESIADSGARGTVTKRPRTPVHRKLMRVEIPEHLYYLVDVSKRKELVDVIRGEVGPKIAVGVPRKGTK